MRYALLLLLLAACAPPSPQVSPAPLTAPSPSAAPPSVLSPYVGEPGTCELKGLSIPLYSRKDPRWGSLSAPVALIVFSDFECPFCARHRHTLSTLKARYGEEKLQIIWKNNPLRSHPLAKPAAEVGEAVFESAGSEAFWRYHDLVFANRKVLSEEALPLFAVEAGVSQEQLQQARDAPSVMLKVKEDILLGQKIGLQGTPLTILNGYVLEGAQDEANFVEIIDKELKAASSPSPHHACDQMRASWGTSSQEEGSL